MNSDSLSQLEAVLYDAFMSAEEPGDVEFFAEKLNSAVAGPVLELGCGSGRVLLDLAVQGYPVEGLDSDLEMLKSARKRAKYLGLEVALHQAKMEEFEPDKRYGALYAPGFSFQLLHEKKTAIAALKRWKQWLLPKGEILLTCYWPWEADDGLRETDWELYNSLEGEFLQQWLESANYPLREQAAQASCFTRSELKLEQQELTRFHRYELRDVQGELLAQAASSLRQRYWSAGELRQVAEQLGYEQIEFYSGFSTYPMEVGDSVWTAKFCRG